MELSEIDQLTNGQISSAVTFAPFGSPLTPDEVSQRLSMALYEQLSEGKDEVTEAAIERAMIYVGAVLRRLSVAFDLDVSIIREVVLIHTIYELHIALGHEEAGREYRQKASDIIKAAWGEFPEGNNTPGPVPGGAVRQGKRS